MIKLSKILSEIKIISKITPKMVLDNLLNNPKVDKKYGGFLKFIIKHGFEKGVPIEWIEKQPQKKLEKMYNELINL